MCIIFLCKIPVTSGGVLTNISVQFLMRRQVLAHVRKTAHAERNGFILKELPRAIFVYQRREQAALLCRRYGLVIRLRNVESGASRILIPWKPVTHWVTLGKSLDLLLYRRHQHWKLGERYDLTEKHMLHQSWASLRKQITVPAAFFSMLCHFACVLWSNSTRQVELKCKSCTSPCCSVQALKIFICL